MCCFLLEVEPLEKPFVKWCDRCKPGRGGCSAYADRPQECADFECLWLNSQKRPAADRMAPELRPDISKVMFGPQSTVDNRHLFVHVHPNYPQAWKAPAIQAHIDMIVRRGGSVTVVIGNRRVIHAPGAPVIETTEEELLKVRP